ncbi:MAG: hypothetical protein IKP10_02145 [Clostridia bacterium]|nr:hypothetical protein [Clostridia bacterium]
MKKWLALLLSLVLTVNLACTAASESGQDLPDLLVDENFDFTDLDDPALLQYLQDSVYAQLESKYAGQETTYHVENVSVVYISREYLEETAYNSKANVFFGYTLAQIDEIFQGTKYVFTLSDSGETIVQEFLEVPDDTYNQIIRNVLIGAGVILVCVVITVYTGGTASPFATMIAMSAKRAVIEAAVYGATTLISTGIETDWDMEAVTSSTLLSASDAFKWGAISGAVSGAIDSVPSNLLSKSKADTIDTIADAFISSLRSSYGIVTPRKAESEAKSYYGGNERVSYFNGEEVSFGYPGGVCPDLIVDNEAIEIKNYDLTHASSLISLRDTLITEISQRVQHLPAGMTQRIVLNVEGRGYSAAHVERVVTWLKESLESVYHDIPIDIMGGMI